MLAVFLLGALLVTVVGLTLLCVVIPLVLTAEKASLKGAWPLFAFFAAIGFGFMLIEISQMQRLILFLGHPTYGLSVVLFSLLLSSGLGSYATRSVGDPNIMRSALSRLAALVVLLAIFGVFTPQVIRIFRGADTEVRVLIATAILFPLGLLMGMAFPLGMKLASSRSGSVTPWLWGINGATSVCASVAAGAIALSSSISTSFWTGFSFYIAALLAFVWAGRKGQ